MTARMSSYRSRWSLTAATLALTLVTVSGQTKIEPPDTSYSVQDDVKLGLEAAAQARKELPMLNDERIDQYVENIGARLVAAIPPEFQHPEFKYTFDVINQAEINAFALPGGPMFLNRGMIEAANTEAEMAGVMAHEISHVALRHGTAQASKAQKWQIGSAIGQILGAVVGGGWGDLIGLGSQIVPGVYVLKYGREFESQADLLGAQILARAGYDPRQMANMFKTIESQGGGGGPEWLSSHPNPGNRFNAIVKEAESLKVQGKGETGQFAAIQTRLGDMGPAYTAEQIAKGQTRTAGSSAPAPAGGRAVVTVEAPSRELRTHRPAQFLQVGIPSNWNAVNDATFAPEGAFFQGQNGQTAFTHGVQFGVMQGTGNLQRDTQSLLQSFSRTNPNLRQQGNAQRGSLDGRQAMTVSLSNVSDVTGQPESIALTTAALPDGNVFYMVGVAPSTEARAYTDTFRRVRSSVRLATR